MENKYYTPEIKEFYVGFEYEEFHDLSRYKIINNELNKWNKKIYNLQDLATYSQEVGDEWIRKSFIEDKNYKEYFRVKYLDQEDIESLGWELDKGMLNQLYNKDNWILIYNTENHRLSIAVKDPSLNLEMMVKLRSTEVFNIIIKNKSELKKLLKQLNIE